jgi:tRNA A37 threonylcarbamoyltransferase TsaD
MVTNPLSTPVYAKSSESVRNGSANFDFEAKFPCVALFLDGSHALILEQIEEDRYTRVGEATFYGPGNSSDDLTNNSSELLEYAIGKVREITIV